MVSSTSYFLRLQTRVRCHTSVQAHHQKTKHPSHNKAPSLSGFLLPSVLNQLELLFRGWYLRIGLSQSYLLDTRDHYFKSISTQVLETHHVTRSGRGLADMEHSCICCLLEGAPSPTRCARWSPDRPGLQLQASHLTDCTQSEPQVGEV